MSKTDVWLDKLTGIFFATLTLLPSLLLGLLFIPVYPKSILGGKYVICGVRDLTSGYDNTRSDNRAVLPISKSSQMITFSFTNGLVTTLRTSGTEPKIKYYSELCATPEQQDLQALKEVLREMVEAIVTEFLEPKRNALIARTP